MTARVVLVTGANNGIGFYLTQGLLRQGFRVAGLDLSIENLAPLSEQFPDQLNVCLCDVTDDAQVEAAVEGTVERWGQVEILVNNACIAHFAPFQDRSLDGIRQEFEVNYFGYLRMIKGVLPHMQAQGHGIIHNLSSGVGITGYPGISGYASTKGAIEALTRTLAMELEPYGIVVNLIHPPLTNTRSAAPLGIPAQMMADPADVGHKLARKIESTKPVITPDLMTALGLFATRHFPEALGRLLARMAQNAKGE